MANDDGPQQIYDRLWAEARPQLAANAIAIDRHLAERAADRRRGITLIARPSWAVAARIAELVDELRAQEPEQYFYRPDELHSTILTPISGSDSFDLGRTPLAVYQSVFAELFARICPFRIDFWGVTASPGAVMVQGFAEDDRLNQLREAIRSELGRAGLGAGLDTRYRIVTAHMTVMRFCAPLRAPQQLVDRLHTARGRDLGSMLVDRIDFVFNDWYMSHDRVQLLASYPLGEP
jgi:2'-5' RNA ligase